MEQNNNKPFWRYIKSKKSDNTGVSPLKQDGVLHYDNETKAEILLNQFKSVFTKSDGKIPKPSKQYPAIDDLVVTEDGVRKLLQNIDVKKAVGPDCLPNIVLKKCAKEVAPALASIFNKSIQTGAVPKDWRDANVAPIFRPQPQRLGAYRFGVSVRPSVRLSVRHRFFSRLYLCNGWS